jgi:hypothetical protein
MDNKHISILWSGRAIKGTLIIKEYLQLKFSQREINNFYLLLESFEKRVVLNPKLYPKSTKNSKFHRAVLSKQLSIFYNVSEKTIKVIAIIDNRMGYSKWP